MWWCQTKRCLEREYGELEFDTFVGDVALEELTRLVSCHVSDVVETFVWGPRQSLRQQAGGRERPKAAGSSTEAMHD